MEKNKIYNEDCLLTMEKMREEGLRVDIVLTSPPYNTSRSYSKSDPYSYRYDTYKEGLTNKEYIDFIVSVFNGYDSVLKKNGCVLFNVSYSSENTTLVWDLISQIQCRTTFQVSDCIVWKKSCAIPNNVSPNKLTRICEFVFVFSRKSEFSTFKMNKEVDSISKKGQKIYKNVFNYIEAANNDESCSLNKATFSSELVRKLLRMYGTEGILVYDSFMGSGTTAIAAIKCGCDFIGCDNSAEYVNMALSRIQKEKSQLKLF